jgi:hypothetical protein
MAAFRMHWRQSIPSIHNIPICNWHNPSSFFNAPFPISPLDVKFIYIQILKK